MRILTLTTSIVAAGMIFGWAGAGFAQQKPAAAGPTPVPAAPTGAAPATLPATSVGVVDIPRLFRESAAGKAASMQLTDLRARFQTEVAKKEESLRVEEAELGRVRATLPPDQFERRRSDLQRKFQETQQFVQERNSSLERAQAQANEEILKVIQQVMLELMMERGFTVVLDQAQVLLSNDAFNVSAEALKRLDRRLPTVRVTLPAAAAPSQPAPGPTTTR